MQLVKPSIEYKSSFIEAVKEYQQELEEGNHVRNNHYKSLNIGDLNSNFQGYVDIILSKEQGLNTPEGHVPESTLWLVDNGQYLGRVNIRHQLTDFLLKEGGTIGYDIRPTQRGKGYGKRMLKLALIKAKELGIEKVLITCNVNNIPSKKVIEANGGIIENRIKSVEKGKPDKLRYWINTV